MEKAEYVIIFSFFLFTSLLTGFSLISPWWAVTTSEQPTEKNATLMAKYSLTPTVIVINGTTLRAVPIENFSTNIEVVNMVKSSLNITLALTLSGSIFNVITFGLIIYSIFVRKISSILKYTILITTVLFLAASAYFVLEAQPKITKFESLFPKDVYELPGTEVNGFWGGIEPTSSSYGWIWGPQLGWVCSVVVFLLNGLFLLLLLKQFEVLMAKA